ncbi:MAG: serine/threonine-protein kinase, partial [Legionella sp.]|nr:serine/threonine-protein kinase [Legionella sp.]
EQNLLFAAFAVQIALVPTPMALEATAAWAADPATTLPDRLVAIGALTEAGRTTVAQLVAAAEAEFDGDTRAALSAAVNDPDAFGRYYRRIALSGQLPDEPSTQAIPDGPVWERTPASLLDETPGRYKGESEYARGGMGRVLLVHDAHLGRDIAMKELLPNVSQSGETLSANAASPVRLSAMLINRFLQEARITGQLEHPSIVPVYELGHRRSGQLYYTMKLVRGDTLSHAIKNAGNHLNRLALLPHVADLCQAIAYAHSRGVLHRDIKPSNVMVGEFGETVVLDWGLAKGRGDRDAHKVGFAGAIRALNTGGEAALAATEYGQIVGTPAYMPPEQARGQLDRVDERSDIYSLGAVLYQILTGQAPHTGATKMDILKHVLDGKID